MASTASYISPLQASYYRLRRVAVCPRRVRTSNFGQQLVPAVGFRADLARPNNSVISKDIFYLQPTFKPRARIIPPFGSLRRYGQNHLSLLQPIPQPSNYAAQDPK